LLETMFSIRAVQIIKEKNWGLVVLRAVELGKGDRRDDDPVQLRE
jgi:hypothetical protein